jgi:hypothetical protein
LFYNNKNHPNNNYVVSLRRKEILHEKKIRLKAKERAELERFSTTEVRSVKLINRAKIIPVKKRGLSLT